MRKVLLLVVLGIFTHLTTYAQLANNRADAEFICASELGVSISNSLYGTEAGDPTPSCLGGAVSQSAWFKVKAQAAGNIEINLKNIQNPKQFAVAAYPEGAINNGGEINCAVLDNGTTTMTFAATAADEVYYVMVEGVAGVEGNFTISATGSAIASPDLILTPTKVIGSFGEDVIFTNNSVIKGDNDAFELVIKFDDSNATIPCEVKTDDWQKPMITDVSGTAKNIEIEPGGEFTLEDDFPNGATITLNSEFPGTWELTIRPKDHECFDARYSQMTMTSDVLRLMAYIKDANGDDLVDDGNGCPAPFCEQTPPSNWQATAMLLPVQDPTSGFKGNVTDWTFTFTDKSNNSQLFTISLGDAGFNTQDQNKTVDFVYAVPMGVADFDVQVEVAGDFGPFDETYNYKSYAPIVPEVVTANGTDSIVVCLADISAGSPLSFNVNNLGDFTSHPEAIAPPITWEFHADMGTDTTSTGSSKEQLSFVSGDNITPGKYTVKAVMGDEGGCTAEGTAIVIVVQKEILEDPVIVTEQPRPTGCNEDTYYPNEKVDFFFTVKDVTVSQKAKVTVTYAGNPVEFLRVLPSDTTANEIIVSSDSATFVASINYTGNTSDFEIVVENLEYPTTCETKYSKTMEPAYEFEEPDLEANRDTVCISDNLDSPWLLTVANAATFSPKATKDSVVWDLGGLVADASNFKGALKDTVMFTKGDKLQYGEYTITATLTDTTGCVSEKSIVVRLVQKETITITNTDRDGALVGCSQNAFYPGEKVDYYFSITDVTPTEGSKITVSFDGSPITFEQVSPSTGSSTEFNLTDSASFKATVVMPDDFTSIPLVIQASNNTYTGVCTPAVRLSLTRAYETNPAVLIIENDTACIQAVNSSSPIYFTVDNADTFSPRALDTVYWDMGAIDPAAMIVVGDKGDTIRIEDRSLLMAGVYDIGVRLVDVNGCEGLGSSKLHLVNSEIITLTDTLTDVTRDDCGTRAYLIGDQITFNFDVSDVTAGQSVQVTASYAGSVVYNVTQSDTTESHSFAITHNGNSANEVLIEVTNIVYPTACSVTRNIFLPVKGENSPQLSASSETVCEKDITDVDPIEILISNATILPGGAGAIRTLWTWSGLNHPMDSTNILGNNIDDTRLQLVGLEADVYTVSANVTYGSGCTDSVTVSFTVLPQADIALDTIELVSTEAACTITDQFQAGDIADYKYQITGIEEDLVVAINYPTDTTFTVNVADGDTFNGSLRFSVSEGGDLGNITVRSADAASNSCTSTLPINIPFTEAPLAVQWGADLPIDGGVICKNSTDDLVLNVVVTPTAGATISWFVNDSLKQESTNNLFLLSNLQEGEDYKVVVKVKNAICEVSDSVLVPSITTNLPSVETNIVSSPENEGCDGEKGFCKGEIIEFEYTPVGGTPPYQVHISIPSENIDEVETLNDNSTQTLQFIVYDEAEVGFIKIWDENSSEACAYTKAIEVPVLELATEIGADSLGSSECKGSLTQVIGYIPECSAVEFDWSNSPNSNLIVGALDESTVTLSFDGQTSGMYDFEVEVSGFGCSRIMKQTIEFSSNLPDTIVASTATTGFCLESLPQNGMVLTAKKFGSNGSSSQVNYDWGVTSAESLAFMRAGTSTTESSLIIDVPADTPVGDYEFLVKVEDRDPGNECSTILSYTLRVIDIEEVGVVNASINNETCTYKDITLHASGGLTGEYTWSQVDPTTGSVIQQFTETSPNLVINSEVAGTFRYMVEDASGSACVEAGFFDLVVTQCDLVIPNAFTPGKDNYNQTFEVKGVGGKDWELVVINRYGSEVYRNANYDNTWDGGSLSDGTYFYTLTSPQGEKVYKGWVRIIRVNPKGDVNR
ncbi:gliding motility-associated C-terminal domain-containing protein [Flammeovirgaceae bacterium SG7u.111]|nr:gliding motility-associated C-terminal domain-containing protein [Flammeovirgaceae bacterium SG7u.132]WPO35566.1 gliding motility-associated C-terminal domain-containing protein [Flammeovirgaceae bacterium SG7u.111]